MSTTPPPPGGDVPPGVPPGSPPPGGAYPPPPPPQPTYQEPPPGTPPPGGPPPAPAGGTGLQPNVAALLAYLLGIVGGIVFYMIEKTNLEVRFHAAQSILFNIAVIVLYIAAIILEFIPGIRIIPWLLIVWLAALVGWIYLMIQGYGLKHTKLPVIGDMAEQWASKPA